jgi:probable phosphoglycerate mutase
MIYLLRHGETEWNREGRLQGHGDSPLTERGLSQAVAMGGALRREIGEAVLAGFTLVSSPQGRALATARCVAAVIGTNPAEIVEEPRLMECGFGKWEGEIYGEIEALYPDEWRAREADHWSYQPPGGESYAQVAERVGAWLAEQPEDARRIVVSHGLAGRILRGLYTGAPSEDVFKMPEPQDAVLRLAAGRIVQLPAALSDGFGAPA